MANVLIIGCGGREHALAWKFSQSPSISKVFTSPQNATEYSCGNEIANLDDIEIIKNFCQKYSIKLVVIGPEKQICDGWTEALSEDTKVFAPSQKASQIEASKSFAKDFMKTQEIPTAEYKTFSYITDAAEYIQNSNFSTFVIKEDGLCAGKGVYIMNTKEEAQKKLYSLNVSSDTPIIIEEFLEGFEISALCFSDGKNIQLMPFSQDHKRAFEGDRGENTGGMGAIAPLFLAESTEKKVKEILQKTIDALQEQGAEYKGVLYAGLMITKDGPKVLEYNCRFGDPETQVLLRLLNSDFYQICMACCDGTLDKFEIEWSNKCAIGFVVASNGYPGSFIKGADITDIPVDTDDTVTFYAGIKKSENGILKNSGGRVLCVTSIGKSFYDAKTKALEGVEKIKFSEKFYRRDIGRFVMSKRNPLSYESAGVNITEGNDLIDSIKFACKETLIPGTDQIGGFGALIDLNKAGFTDPLLVLGMDGVGTKLEVASEIKNFSSLGYDLVGMCVNDVLCHGAAPLAFLDYYVTGKLKKEEAAEVICGIAKACKEAGAALVGGETAEMPGVYGPNQWDLAGCCIGAKEREWPAIPEYDNIRIDDIIIGITSNGLHSNGFSLVRKIFKENCIAYDKPTPWNANQTFGDELLKPTKIYIKPLLQLVTSHQIKALAHITGGGLTENVPRILPKTLSAEIDCKNLHILDIFKWLQKAGDIQAKEMFRTFNCGVGMVAVVDAIKSSHVLAEIEKAGIHAYEMGKICKKPENGDSIILHHVEDVFDFGDAGVVQQKRANVAIFISGTGSNMINLINQASNPSSYSNIRLVICNRPEAHGLERAREKGIEAICIPHGDDRHAFEDKIHQELIKRDIDFICLAGFMRILTGEFTQKWINRIINIHPSILPSFKGAHAVKLALEAGVKVTGCTAHFVSEEVDAGKIIAQEVVAVEEKDDEKTLHSKIQEKEHLMFPKVMEIVAKSIVCGI
uniref:Trifunctional purine biosynthetic protein adenosine-3 n=1 Tax=Panagrolaimus superbus TaxID=310955 RepID=A0A914Z9N9_9BILA